MTFKLREGVFTAETDYGIALLDEDHNQYWTLNPSAAVALRKLLDGGTETDAAQKLTEEYSVDIDTAHRDVRELVGGLHAAGLAEESTKSPSAPRARLVRRRVHRRWPHLRGRQQRKKSP